jgi:hypothetical protein
MTLLRLLSMIQATGTLLSVTTTAAGGVIYLDRMGEDQVRRYPWNGDEPDEEVVRQVFRDLERDMTGATTERDPLLEEFIR